ncbi:hypothetical protein [Dysosmobacter sp. HCP28S3_G4]|jgi:hypothetical protein|uniref:hypothetical protein n=1 Tax=Dysosmobacter sp. HCP28S3_G4 TaxID=3438938 RepID=UPI003F8A826A
MALRIPWDIEEAVLMLDMLLKSIDGKLTRKEAIRQVSEKLRRRAVNRGITIDDIFRNENGITFQMSALEVAYTGIKTKLKQPTKLFVETVNLYRNHRELYEEILKEAENVVEPKSVQDEFCSYLSMQMPTFQLSDAYLMLSDIESFCLERKILQNKLFETTDLEAIKRVVQTVDSNRVFRFTYKQNLKKMSTVIHAYYAFLKSYKPDEEKEVKPIIQDAIPSLPDADSMKQKDDAVGPQAISVPVAERTKLTDQEEKQKFNDWMLSSGMSKATITSYMSSFGQCVKSVANYKLCETSLWNVANAEDASHIYDQLFGISEFYEYNKQQHNRFSAAFRKFIEYRSGGSPASLKPSQPTQFAVEKKPTRRKENDPVLIRYKELLDKFFQKGFRMESSLDMKKLRRFYQDQYGTELSDEDALVCQDISSVTILHEGKAYLPDSMLSQEKKEKLLQYIEDKFVSGCDAIYYSALFSEFEEAFQGERIYTPEMLKTYLSYINKGNYVLQRSYLAKDYTVQMNPEDDIREYLKEAAGPVEVERLAAELSYIPEQKIKFALSTNNDFIWNATGEYFYEDCVHFSNSELEWISQFILDGIEERDFVTGNELVEAVEAHFPDIKEMYQWITPVGMRNVIGYKLNDRFSFNGNIISKYGEDLSMAEVYAKYCRKHSRFTLDELNVLKQELGSTIYFDEIYANSLRISQNEFVSQDMAQFDVEATDEAIGRICTGQYMSLQEIRDFGTFPYAGYPWNEYLLEHFVANYSQKFMLLHIGFSANVCAGAIVKQASSCKDFNDLLVDILANSNIVLDEDSALEYLRQQGYIARRRYSDIGRIVTEAKVVRSKKG